MTHKPTSHAPNDDTDTDTDNDTISLGGERSSASFTPPAIGGPRRGVQRPPDEDEDDIAAMTEELDALFSGGEITEPTLEDTVRALFEGDPQALEAALLWMELEPVDEILQVDRERDAWRAALDHVMIRARRLSEAWGRPPQEESEMLAALERDPVGYEREQVLYRFRTAPLDGAVYALKVALELVRGERSLALGRVNGTLGSFSKNVLEKLAFKYGGPDGYQSMVFTVGVDEAVVDAADAELYRLVVLEFDVLRRRLETLQSLIEAPLVTREGHLRKSDHDLVGAQRRWVWGAFVMFSLLRDAVGVESFERAARAAIEGFGATSLESLGRTPERPN